MKGLILNELILYFLQISLNLFGSQNNPSAFKIMLFSLANEITLISKLFKLKI